jgi:hypothetical protein
MEDIVQRVVESGRPYIKQDGSDMVPDNAEEEDDASSHAQG